MNLHYPTVQLTISIAVCQAIDQGFDPTRRNVVIFHQLLLAYLRGTAAVVPILKPGKDPTQPSSYRPISLLSSIRKIAENIILI
ncbi:hypothetical protein AVEN_18467-1, partial [Araneus ventricosus]